ncbi:hypothetical protein EU537_08615 [Candidatus Thorarchaeota archaeon]|nr:MAG: hypothetical protein EU537_08615 [Candidatus Thorarchaeota archaeon]
MFRSLRFPTKRQTQIWMKRRRSVSPSEIARNLKVSRPYISKAQRIAEKRITKLLRNAASINRIDIESLSSRFGFASGYCHTHNTNTFITFSPKFGVHVWYDHIGNCDECERKSECDKILRGLAKEWQISISEDESPSTLAGHLFSEIRRKLGWE